MFLETCPFLLGYSICWHIIVHSWHVLDKRNLDVGMGRGSHCLPVALRIALMSQTGFATLSGAPFTFYLLSLIFAAAL